MTSEMQQNIKETYVNIRNILIEARTKVAHAVNFVMVQAYWSIGRIIVEEEQKGENKAKYGSYLIKELSKKLTNDFGKGFTPTNLKYIRRFYLLFQNSHTLCDQLSWSHYRLLLKVKSVKARIFYMQEVVQSNWSVRALERQINSFYYERILSSKDKIPVKREAEEKTSMIKPENILKDPYVLEFLDLKDRISYRESELEQALIDKLQEFLMELGKGFSFVNRQKRISAEDEHFYIDLVFYNYLLKCFVLIDLKIGKLTHQDIGQMDMYIRMYEDKYKVRGDNPTIGIILCSEKNEAVVKYSILQNSKQLFSSKYQLYLPTEEELIKELKRERRLLEQQRIFHKQR